MTDILVFISSKLWFWLALAIMLLTFLLTAFMACLKYKPSTRKEKIIVYPPLLLTLSAWMLFVIAVLCRAWGV